jgi:hypothetical protein
MSIINFASWMFLILVVCFTGCDDGPEIVPVSGQVLIDGKPLDFGYVRFLPPHSRLSGGALDADGRFKLSFAKGREGAVLGAHQVEVMAAKHLSDTKIQWYAPKKYASAATSGLTYEVTGPTDNAMLNLTWKGGKPYVETLDGNGQEGSDPY